MTLENFTTIDLGELHGNDVVDLSIVDACGGPGYTSEHLA